MAEDEGIGTISALRCSIGACQGCKALVLRNMGLRQRWGTWWAGGAGAGQVGPADLDFEIETVSSETRGSVGAGNHEHDAAGAASAANPGAVRETLECRGAGASNVGRKHEGSAPIIAILLTESGKKTLRIVLKPTRNEHGIIVVVNVWLPYLEHNVVGALSTSMPLGVETLWDARVI